MKKKLIIFAGIFLIMVFPAFAAEYEVDLSLKPHDVTLSKDQNNLIAGDKVRIYATVFNNGSKDATGHVLFMRGPEVVGQSEVSLRNGGVYDEVFADFIVPTSDFNVLVRLTNISPEDNNLNNNETLSQMFHVQGDNDKDGQGDDIDNDDDNDGLTDDQELAMGTDPKKADTDGDGYSDKDDLFPLDSKKWKKEEPKVTPTNNQVPSTNSQTNTDNQTSNSNQTTTNNQNSNTNNQTATIGLNQDKILPPTDPKKAELVEAFYKSDEVVQLKDVDIQVRQVNWNTFFFSFNTNIKDLDTEKLQYMWNYDGTGTTIEGYHKFTGLGKHNVDLKVLGPWDNYLYDNIDVYVTFWSIYNYWIWLIALLILGILFYFASHFTHRTNEAKIKRELKQPKGDD